MPVLTNWKNCGETQVGENKNWVFVISMLYVFIVKAKTVDLIKQLFSFTSCCGDYTNLDLLLWFDMVFFLSIEHLSWPQTIFRKLGHIGYEDLNFSIYRG